MEGLVLIASRHPKSTIFRKFGSPLGLAYLDMLATDDDTDAAADFHTWVAAQAIQLKKGCEPSLPQKRRVKPTGDISDKFRVGNLAQNISAIRSKLKDLIHIASGRKLRCAWPGEDSENRLREKKLSIKIDQNDWNIVPSDLYRPLVKISAGMDTVILACLGLNKIHVTYHPDWETPSKPRKKLARRKKNLDDDEESSQDEDEDEPRTNSNLNDNALEGQNGDSNSPSDSTDQPSSKRARLEGNSSTQVGQRKNTDLVGSTSQSSNSGSSDPCLDPLLISLGLDGSCVV
ncbi:hypothetical protein PGT21_007083 [Puccinia graminis f. sp. tritici]|uniref:Uncharacterized protein n=1 Tax=Puccinia graminis f. sp. tritici TaxID=56615 RepID=A0A5B0QHL7_PUCGR|nr:hypothetical protein PGT21_007083 [Puccinia graminis f. sp. tritici]